ncbi:Bgt-20022-2 [Blumeria graminis f. sp. tritici]|uniref:Bgt-20022-2 n=1 Tax=Blumeria graminis f. sp. tritici TaxID=62690 RepID=A0A9X9MIV3_BLUGR|nr:Bgt-20022-2 [Blumeria graminis f. sp. tritici]
MLLTSKAPPGFGVLVSAFVTATKPIFPVASTGKYWRTATGERAGAKAT